MFDTGYWILDAGSWILGIGCWSELLFLSRDNAGGESVLIICAIWVTCPLVPRSGRRVCGWDLGIEQVWGLGGEQVGMIPGS